MTEHLEDLTFEEALQELEAIVAQLEEGALSLDHSLRLFERGQLLATQCSKQLEEATLRVGVKYQVRRTQERRVATFSRSTS